MKEAHFCPKVAKTGLFIIAPEWIRTTDLPLRRRSLYPTELRALEKRKGWLYDNSGKVLKDGLSGNYTRDETLEGRGTRQRRHADRPNHTKILRFLHMHLASGQKKSKAGYRTLTHRTPIRRRLRNLRPRSSTFTHGTFPKAGWGRCGGCH